MSRTRKLIVMAVCLVGLGQLVWSQSEKPVPAGTPASGIPGFLDPKSHTFTARAEAVGPEVMRPEDSVAGAWYYGDLQIVLTIYVASAFPSGTVYLCYGDLNTYDTSTYSGTGTLVTAGNNNSYTEYAEATAPAPSGGYTTCTLNFNYFWQLENPTADSIYIDFSAQAVNVTNFNGVPQSVVLRQPGRSGMYMTGVPTTDSLITTFKFSTRL